MARGRMINKKISNSKRVNDMPLQAQLLFTWLIPHLDCNGCFYGSAQMVKSLVIPRKNYSKIMVEKWLTIMENSNNDEGLPLIYRYSVNSEAYLCMPGFASEQTGLRYDKEKAEFPTLDGNNTENIGQSLPLSRREVEVEVKEEEKDKDNNIYTLYEGEIGKLSASVTEELKELEGQYPMSEIRKAFKIAATNNKRSLGYVKGILKKEGKKDAPESLLRGSEE